MSETPPRNNTFLTEQMLFEMSSIKSFSILQSACPTMLELMLWHAPPGGVLVPGVNTASALQQPNESLQECAVFQTQFPMI